MKNKTIRVFSLVMGVLNTIVFIYFAYNIIPILISGQYSANLVTYNIIATVIILGFLAFNAFILFLTYFYCKKMKQFDTDALNTDKERKAKKKQQKLIKLQNKIDKLEK